MLFLSTWTKTSGTNFGEFRAGWWFQPMPENLLITSPFCQQPKKTFAVFSTKISPPSRRFLRPNSSSQVRSFSKWQLRGAFHVIRWRYLGFGTPAPAHQNNVEGWHSSRPHVCCFETAVLWQKAAEIQCESPHTGFPRNPRLSKNPNKPS